MVQSRVIALDEDRRPAIAAQQVIEFLVRDSRKHGRIGNLVTIQMQDRQHGAIGRRIEEFVRMPGRRQWPRLRLAVTDHASDDQFRIVERGAKRMAE